MKTVVSSFLLAVVLVLLCAGPNATGQAAGTTFSGQATVVSATVLGNKVTLSDTGPLPSSGGAQEASLLTASVPGVLTADVLHASTVGQGDRSRSEASVADVNLTVGGNTIAADFLTARATAICTSNGPAATGSADILNLQINNQNITVTGQPNQMVGLPTGGGVIINEQKSNGAGDITVNALHVLIPGVADVVISSAHADVTCPGPPSCTSANDFVTGGGWIPLPSGAKANFAVAGGDKNGALWGHLLYIDHGTGMKVKGTGVTKYVVTGTTSRHIEGTADIDGQLGTYSVDVADNGEPGRGVDTFSIQLSNGYSASSLLGGGNIQLHKVCQ